MCYKGYQSYFDMCCLLSRTILNVLSLPQQRCPLQIRSNLTPTSSAILGCAPLCTPLFFLPQIEFLKN